MSSYIFIEQFGRYWKHYTECFIKKLALKPGVALTTLYNNIDNLIKPANNGGFLNF